MKERASSYLSLSPVLLIFFFLNTHSVVDLWKVFLSSGLNHLAVASAGGGEDRSEAVLSLSYRDFHNDIKMVLIITQNKEDNSFCTADFSVFYNLFL